MLRILHGDTRDLEACPTEAKRADRHEQRLHTLDPGPEVVDPLQYQLVAGKGDQIHAVEYRAGVVSGPQERLQMVRDLTIGVQELAFAAIRQAKPQLTDDEIWLQLAARRLGADLVLRIYGERFKPESD